MGHFSAIQGGQRRTDQYRSGKNRNGPREGAFHTRERTLLKRRCHALRPFNARSGKMFPMGRCQFPRSLKIQRSVVVPFGKVLAFFMGRGVICLQISGLGARIIAPNEHRQYRNGQWQNHAFRSCSTLRRTLGRNHRCWRGAHVPTYLAPNFPAKR